MRFSNYFYQNYNQLLTESKQEIINIGYPKIIADYFYSQFGKHAFKVAKWYKDNKDYVIKNYGESNWFMMSQTRSGRGTDIKDAIKLYNAAANNSAKEYMDVLDNLEIPYNPDEYDEYHLNDMKNQLHDQIFNDFSRDHFFSYRLIKDIKNGIVKNIAAYKDFPFEEAQEKYDKKLIFRDKDPIKIYSDGYRWIDVGSKCTLIARSMKNCGSSGVMGTDPNRTMIALFDSEDKPHVLTVYHPSENRISGDESVGSQPVKEKYHAYVLDLADHLNAVFDEGRSKSKLLRLKYLFKNKIREIEEIGTSNAYNEYYKFIDNNNIVYYTDTNFIISEKDIKKLIKNKYKFRYKLDDKSINTFVQAVFSHRFDIEKSDIDQGVNFMSIYDYAKNK